MNGESHYTGWSSKSNVSYQDYLQGKEFEKSIRYGIDAQTQQLIASNEQLARENYEALEHISDGINSGFAMLSASIEGLEDKIDQGFNRIAAIFEWGFSEMLVSLGHINDNLAALIKIAKTPAQTWSYEQFEIARDEFRRGLYHESLESVLRAIDGYGSNPGYKTEFRFHFLQGIILLGSFKNSDPQLVNPAGAEAAFLKASRYSRNDFPLEAANALLCAGRAAYVQKKFEDSLKYSLEAILLDNKLVEAYFQSAQNYCALGRPEEGKQNLVTAIFYEHDYAIKAASDGDICQYPDMLNKALIEARDKLKITYEQEKNIFETKINKMKESAVEGYIVKNLCSEQLEEAYTYEKTFDLEASKNNIFGYVQATKLARETNPVIQPIVTSFKMKSSELIDKEQHKIKNTIANIDSEINDIQNNIVNIGSEATKSRPGEDFDLIDMALGGVAEAALLFLFLGADIALGVIAVIVVATIATSGFVGMLILYPASKIINFIRKSMWETKLSTAQSRQQELKDTIGSESVPKKQQLQQKISELQNIKGRIESFSFEG